MEESADRHLDLGDSEIHLWITRPDSIRDTALLSRYQTLLTAEESRKQQRFLFARHRHAALVTRAFLRDLLSCYADVPPADWRFAIGERGKPEIIDPPLPLRFNLSHTMGLIICAVNLVEDIGCDVENVQRRTDPLAIARQNFSATEVEELFSLPQADQKSRFFDYWTLKESYIKACGSGIFGVPLQDFSFAIGPHPAGRVNDNIRISFASSIDQRAQDWLSWLYSPNERYRIAVSVRSTALEVSADVRKRFRVFLSTPLATRSELPWGGPVATQ